MARRERHPFETRLARWPAERLATILVKRVGAMLRYFPAQIEMDMAHTVMLKERGILDRAEAAGILGVLDEMRQEGVDRIKVDGTRSTLFWYVESRLIAQLGEQVGGKMHTGRSHNDILPTISRLTARHDLLQLMETLTGLQAAILDLAARHVHSVMPGYTSLQHAQPWTFGHYLSAWSYAFERDFTRLRHAYETTNRSPLGASALAGSSWPLDRSRTAALLGFDGVIVNSRDAGFGTKDYVAEILAAVSIMMSDLGLLSSDLYLWSSYEFGMVELADGYCGTSSQMPQKKNPWAVDWTRGAVGASIGHFASCLGALKGASTTDGAAQDYPEAPLAESMETASDHLGLMTGVLETLEVKTEVMAERAAANWATANSLADAIVRSTGLSFRAAHGVVGALVREATARGTAPAAVTAAMVDRSAIEIVGKPVGLSDAAVREALDPEGFIRSRVTVGSVNPKEVRRMLRQGRASLGGERKWLAAQNAAIAQARGELARAVARIRKTGHS